MPPLRWTGAFVYKENKGIYYRESTIFLALPGVGAIFTWKSRHVVGESNTTFCPKHVQPELKAVLNLGLRSKPQGRALRPLTSVVKTKRDIVKSSQVY